MSGQHGDRFRLHIDAREIDRLHSNLRGQGDVKIFLTDITQLDQDLSDRASLFLLDFERFGNLGAVDAPHLDQDATHLPAFELADGGQVQCICHSTDSSMINR